MKAEKTLKRFIAIRRKHEAKKNGVIPFMWDWPHGEISIAKSKRRFRRNKKISYDDLA